MKLEQTSLSTTQTSTVSFPPSWRMRRIEKWKESKRVDRK